MALSAVGQTYAALELISQPVWVFDIDKRRVHWANSPALQVWKAHTLAALQARDLGQDMSAAVAQRLAQYQRDFEAHGAVFSEQWTLYPAGEPVAMNVRFSGHRLPDGRMAMMCEGRPVQSDLPESLRAVEALVHTALMISLYDAQGRPLYRNPAARNTTRFPQEGLAERLNDPEAIESLLSPHRQDQVVALTVQVRTAQGLRWHEITAHRCRDAATGQDAILVSEADVNAIKHTEAHAQYLALHDSLTGLPNRSQVMGRFADTLRAMLSMGRMGALVFLDVDHFKHVNDALGHFAGDELLVNVAQRLRSVCGDMVARLGGDEFLILLLAPDIQAEVQRIVQAVTQPLSIYGASVRVKVSMGVSLFPDHGEELEILLRHADIAMYEAKRRGRNKVVFYNDEMGRQLRTRVALESELQLAIERGEFEVHYQPRVSVQSHRIVGMEALVRWRHPERGLVPPNVFIEVCERTGLIGPLGLWVFEQAVRQQVAWAAQGHDLQVSINLSPRQMADPQLVEQLGRILAQEGGNPRRVELEITESMLLDTEDRSLAVLSAIGELGMSIALDDFGTGYSNLAYLQRYPLHTLKIDKAFIQESDAKRPLAEMIVSLCRLMKLNVVAEGVETCEQLGWVGSHHIGEYQGYHFSRPVPVAEFSALLDLQPDC